MILAQLKNIVKTYGNGQASVKALNNVSLEINNGDFIAIMGPSGCGKSTLLNILGAIDLPTEGEYKLKDITITKENINSLSKIRNSEIGFIFQNFSLIKEYTVFENVYLPLKFRKIKVANGKKLVLKYLTDLGINNLENKLVSELSGGQQQRVAICRALVQEGNLILADEPTGALDQENGKKIMDIFCNLNKNYNKTVIIVTHDTNVANYCKKIITMRDGKIIDIKPNN